MITGSSTQGASIIGSVSDEIAPSVVSTSGDSANAAAARTRDVGLPMPLGPKTRSVPTPVTEESSCVRFPAMVIPCTGWTVSPFSR